MAANIELHISDMHCASCVSQIEGGLAKVEGVKAVSVNFGSGVVRIEAEGPTKPEDLIDVVKGIGYTAMLPLSPRETDREERRALLLLKVKMWLSLILSVPLVVNMGIPEFYLPGWIQLVLAGIVQVYGGAPFYVGTYKSLRHFSANMDVLVALGTTVAFLYSIYNLFWGVAHHLYFETSAVLIAFILIGRVLEHWSKAKAKKGMTALLSMQARSAVVQRDGETLHVKIEDVVVGDRVLVAPYERVPVDGVIVDGSTSIDESMLTGESFPV